VNTPGTNTWQRALALVALASLALGLTPAEAADPAEAKVEPALLRAAQARPGQRFHVIVTREAAKDANTRRAAKAALKADLLADVERVGPDLDLIEGQAVTVKGAQVVKLATKKNVAAVAWDRPVQLAQVPSVGSITTVATTAVTATVAAPAPASLSPWTQEANAPAVWATGNRGAGVTVAVLDSGVAPSADLANVVFGADFTTGGTGLADAGGHGSHVAGIVAGTGSLSGGAYAGVAPGARIVSVKVTNDTGGASYSGIIQGLQWVVKNKAAYNIRVANLSLGAPVQSPYAADPLNAAVEMAWFRGVVVVASAGNTGPGAGTISVPGNDPYVVTVGAVDDNQTGVLSDDLGVDWSSQGPTLYDGFAKPDVAASGRRVVSLRSLGSFLDQTLPDRVEGDGKYFRLSGTSMSAPVVAGVAALMITQRPTLTPNEVKYILKQTAKPVAGLGAGRVGAGMVDAKAAVALAAQGVPPGKANAGQQPNPKASKALWPVVKKMSPVWRNKGWWKGRYWVDGGWDQTTGFKTADGGWDDGGWDQTAWDNFAWEDGGWDDGGWDDGGWDVISSAFSWSSSEWDATEWDATNWNALRAQD
jgi:serine protease AprX